MRWGRVRSDRLVLVVEDDSDISELVCVILEGALGVCTALATDGKQGLDLTRELRPALVLLDLGLPQLDGCEVAKRLKADLTTAAIPVIAVTARSRLEAMGAGCDDCVGKPFEPDDLIAKVRGYLADPVAEGTTPGIPASAA
jgi:DNA-binding response OmpR family regulator